MVAPRRWYRCTVCDIRFLSRSPESLKHGRIECDVIDEGEA